MTAPSGATTTPAGQELVITRVFAAPRGVVFRAWTEAGQLERWFGPKGFTVTSCTMNVRPGGGWRLCLRSPEGTDHWVRGVYREVVEPERLVTSWAWEDAGGVPGKETVLTVTLAERDGATELTLHQAAFTDVQDRDNHHHGWSESLDRLADRITEAGR